MITGIRGVRVGHWTEPVARTGCTVVLLPAGTVASGEVRGGAPGTREWALLDPTRTVDRVDAVVLSGGSAFGLAACDGVATWCEERGIGWPTPGGPVPIVVGMVVYDLTVGDPRIRPGPGEGYQACVAAQPHGTAIGDGRIGAGTGATAGKWQGPGFRPRPAGLGSAVAHHGDVVVAALMVVNAVGDELAPHPNRIARVPPAPGLLEATTIGVVLTNARLSKLECLKAAESGHDGMARALDPVHTSSDGDAIVVAATGETEAPIGVVRALASWVVEQAIRSALAPTS